MSKKTFMCRFSFLRIIPLLLLPFSVYGQSDETAAADIQAVQEPVVATRDTLDLAPLQVETVEADSVNAGVYEISDGAGDTAYIQGIKVEAADPEPVATEKTKGRVYQGAYISLDVFDPFLTLFNGGRFQFEVSADVGLWHRLFPVIDFGMMFYNPNLDDYSYNVHGLFFKAGAGYNLINNDNTRRFDHAVIIGMRYAYSNVYYSLDRAVVQDSYWGNGTLETSAPTQVANVGWIEVVAMVRVQMAKSFFMSLGVKVQFFPHIYGPYKSHYPTYVPGFGQYADGVTNWNFDLSFCYQFPYKKSSN